MRYVCTALVALTILLTRLLGRTFTDIERCILLPTRETPGVPENRELMQGDMGVMGDRHELTESHSWSDLNLFFVDSTSV